MLESTYARNLISATGGRFMTVVFIKKDGSRRVLNGRTGVTSYLRGGESKLNKEQYVIIYDVHAKGYRAVDISQIEEIRYGKRVIN